MTHPTHSLSGLLRRTTPGNRLVGRNVASDPFHLFDQLFGPQLRAQGGDGPARYIPHMDVIDDEGALRLDVELPGMEEKDVELIVEDGVLTLRGEKKRERELEEGGRYRLERAYGSFERRLHLPDEVDADGATATYKQGVLSIVLPKVEPVSKARRIDVKSA